MANELITKLDLDIKPFLDALRRVASQVQQLENIRPRINTREFQNLANTISKGNLTVDVRLRINDNELNNLRRNINAFDPQIDLGINVNETELNQAQDSVNSLEASPIDLNVQVNTEEIQRSVNRFQELRSIVQTIPPAREVILDTNAPEVNEQINQVEEALIRVTNFRGVEVEIPFNEEEIISKLKLTESAFQELDKLQVVGLGFDDILDATEAFQALTLQAEKLGLEIRDIPKFEFSSEGFERTAKLLNDLTVETANLRKETLQKFFPTLGADLLDDAKFADTLAESIERITSVLGKLPESSIKDITSGSEEVLNELNEIEKGIRELAAEKVGIPIELVNVEKVIEEFGIVSNLANKDANVTITADTSDADKDVDSVNKKINEIPESKKTTIFIPNANAVNADLNSIEKNVNDIPNQKNVKINVDTAQAGKSLTGATGFVGQLGSGLLASFSGAAIGAAIANFATQSVRAISEAANRADELRDALELAFKQAGAQGPTLAVALRDANQFAFELGDNFGISIQRSQQLLSQVIGLTGEFGATSEAITKASIGIETATNGLVKAEVAAKLFSRSIGNPEDQAALETLAKRFPAIGEAIKNATDPAEKANAVISNLSGTFAALEEQSKGFSENLTLLGEVGFGAISGALIPAFDAFSPILESIRNLIAENADAFADFGQRITRDFIEPFVNQLLAVGPQFTTFFEGLFAAFGPALQGNFASLSTTIQILGAAFEYVGQILIGVAPLLQEIADLFTNTLQTIVQTITTDFENFSDALGLTTNSANEAITPLTLLDEAVTILSIGIKTLADNLEIFLVPALKLVTLAMLPQLTAIKTLQGAYDGFAFVVRGLSIDLDNLTGKVLAFSTLVFPPLIGVLNLINNIKKAVGTGVEPIADVTRDFNSALQNERLQKYNLSVGDLIKQSQGATRAKKTLTSATKEGTAAQKTELSELQKTINSFGLLTDRIEERYTIEIAKINQLQKAEELKSTAGLSDIRKAKFEQDKLNASITKSTQLQDALKNSFGVAADELAGLVEQYLDSGDAGVFRIKVNPEKPEEAKRAVDEILKIYKNSLATESEKAEFSIRLKQIRIETNETAFTNEFNRLQNSINDQFRALETGITLPANFDVVAIRTSLEAFRDSAQQALVPFNAEIQKVEASIAQTAFLLDRLKESGIESGEEFKNYTDTLAGLQSQLIGLEKQTSVYNDVVQKTTDDIEKLGDRTEQSIQNIGRTLAERSDFQLTLELNAEGVRPGLIEIERDFNNSLNNLQTNFEIAKKRLEAQGLSTEALEASQKNLLQNLGAQRELAIRQFRLQNDAVFAITESLRTNLASALNPDTTQAKKAFDQRQEQLNNEAELLKINLDNQLITYQEYNASILEIEQQRADSIKTLEEETAQVRLDNLKKIADDALPAINNQLLESQTAFTSLLKDGSAAFEDVANKGLEVVGLIAAQSLAIAVQQAQSLEEVQKAFVKTTINAILRVLQAELVAAVLEAIFEDVKKAGSLGLITGAITGAALAVLFGAAEAKLIALLGYESGGYTGNGGTKEVAGVVHGQEFVMNAKGTKNNREALEWVNKTGGTFEQWVKGANKELGSEKYNMLSEQVLMNLDSRISNLERGKNELNINNYVDTKSMSSSINSLAYTMDSRLSSLEGTVDKAIRQNATLTRSANQLDVSVYSDPGTAIKYMKKIGKIKGLS